MKRQIFLNLPVNELPKSKAFFSSLGFSFNEQFSDDTAACLVISEEIHAMLLTHDKFRTFTPKEVCDSAKYSEVLIALSCESREEVDSIAIKAITAGAEEFREPQDHGFMYGRTFYDLDGHIWELMFMDMSALPANMPEGAATA